MSCHEWAHTDTNHDYFADCSERDGLYLHATACSTGAHPTADKLTHSYPCEEGGYGPLSSSTRTDNGHLDHSLAQCNDDPSFRLRGFSCAQWGVPHNGMEVPCMESNDQHWLDRGYTQAELDSLRHNCPATCASPTCAHKHFYYPAWLMNQVRLHCPKACSSSCSGTPFG